MEIVRDWRIIDRWEKDIISSKKTIAYFQQTIMDLQRKNEDSQNYIIDQEDIVQVLIRSFEEKNNINFSYAKKLVEDTFNPDSKYNLKEFNVINNIIQQIDAEKFFVNYRLEMMEKNKKFIEDTTKWIIAMEKELDKFKK
ncbi:MAG: hypothetical protein RSA40_00190 [Malacoplasma sp.]